MLGKTHVVGSLALAHTALIGYTLHKRNEAAAAIDISVYGVTLGEQLSFVEYGLMILIVSIFAMVLLRIGGSRSRITQAVTMLVLLVILNITSGGTYPFIITVGFLCFTLGSILPDIDSEDSTIGRYILPISRVIPHRTVTHTAWIVILLFLLAWLFQSFYLSALALGYFLHIIQDSFSDKGIRWFYPLPKLSYEVGGLGETVAFIGTLGLHLLCAGFALWMLI